MAKDKFGEQFWSQDLFDGGSIGGEWNLGDGMGRQKDEGLAQIDVQKNGVVKFGEKKRSKKEGFLLIGLVLVVIIVMGGLTVQLVINEQKNYERKLWAARQEEEALEMKEAILTPEVFEKEMGF